MENITVRVFITTYKNIPYLTKVLQSLEQQTFKDFSVSILEDGSQHDLRDYLSKQLFPFQVEHFDQEDKGFRKNRILNIGISNATEDLIIFLDEDCIVHPCFIEQYVKHFDENTVGFAKRVNLDEETTKQIIASSEFKKPSLLPLLFRKANHIEDGIYLPFIQPKKTEKPKLLGCNMAIPLSLLKKVNGFDEDYESPGYGEDSDIQWRLQKEGVNFIKMKYLSVQYHLFHERPNREDQTAISRELFEQKKAKGDVICKNGLKKN